MLLIHFLSEENTYFVVSRLLLEKDKYLPVTLEARYTFHLWALVPFNTSRGSIRLSKPAINLLNITALRSGRLWRAMEYRVPRCLGGSGGSSCLSCLLR